MSLNDGTRGRIGLMALLAACTSVGPIALNVYLPGLPAVQAEFGASLTQVQSTVSLALVAFGLTLVLVGPFSDRYGRRRVLLCGLAAFTLGSLCAFLAPDIATLTAGRMLQSVGAAVTYICSRAVVSDLTPRDQLQRSIAQITMIMLVGQMAAPVLGTLALAAGGWRAIQAFLLATGLVLCIVVFYGLRETLVRTQDAATAAARGFLSLLMPTVALLGRARMRAMLAQVGFLYSAYPAFIATAPHLMVEAFGRPASEFGYYFALLPAGYFTGNWFVLHFGQRLGAERVIRLGTSFAAACCAVGVLLLVAGFRHPLVLFLPAGLLLNFGLGLALPSVAARAVGESWPNTASGWGAVGFSQQFVAAMSVQLLGTFGSASPYPVMVFCLILVVMALAMESVVGRHPHLERGP